MPLYILGLMGMTRRLNHYDNPAWQPYLVVAVIGAVVILFGILFFVLQIVVSVVQRERTRDVTGDPWGGRTLEWSVSSPPPFYNFATTPVVYGRDTFWEMKQRGIAHANKAFRPIHMPRNTGTGPIVGAFSLVLGFALVWHIWWMALGGLLGIVLSIIAHSFNENRAYFVPVEDVARIARINSPLLAQV
jgi:cytochrome o ubiquinol oxidase subunit I